MLIPATNIFAIPDVMPVDPEPFVDATSTRVMTRNEI